MESTVASHLANLKILLVDDDLELCELLEEYLRADRCSVESVSEGELGLERARSGEHDLVILDIMLPGISGLEVLRQIRRDSELPILILTAKTDEIDRIVGLEIGADDYVAKPVNPRELLARVRTILRRSFGREVPGRTADKGKRLQVGDIILDPGARSVTCLGRPVRLTSVEFDLLEILLRSAGSVVSRDELCREALERDLFPTDRAVDMHVSRLRNKLGNGIEDEERIKTVRGVGYLLVKPSDDGDFRQQDRTSLGDRLH